MKPVTRRVCGFVLGVGLLNWNTGLIADDWTHQQAQAQAERDDWYRQQAQAQKERDEWYAQQAQAQKDRELAERDQKWRDEWDKYQWQVHLDYQNSILNREYEDHPWARAGWTAGAEWKNGGWELLDGTSPGGASSGSASARYVSAAAKAPVIRRPRISQIRVEGNAVSQPSSVPPQPLVILNPFALPQMVPENQGGAAQPTLPKREQQMLTHQELSQVIQNPFVGAAK